MRNPHLRGIGAMLVAVALFAFMDAVLKRFAGYYPALQVGALRGAASVPFVLLSVASRGAWAALRPQRVGLHLARGVLAVIMLTGFVYAVGILSLADTYAVFFVAPLLVTALSVPVLGEHVDWQRWTAIAVGLGGVLWMLRPTGTGLTVLGAAAAIAAAVAYAISVLTVRILTRTDSNTAMVFWYLLLLALFAGVLSIPGWVAIRPEDWVWIAAMGALGAAAQHFITEAFRHAPASVIAPFEYTAMLWAVGLDWLIWSVLPSANVYVGASVVIACGLYLIWRENQLHRELAALAEAPGATR